MGKTERNQREFLKCLHEIAQALGAISHFIEKGDKDDMVKRINREMSSLRNRLDKLDSRIGML